MIPNLLQQRRAQAPARDCSMPLGVGCAAVSFAVAVLHVSAPRRAQRRTLRETGAARWRQGLVEGSEKLGKCCDFAAPGLGYRCARDMPGCVYPGHATIYSGLVAGLGRLGKEVSLS